jgi:hypothetical protein
LPPSPLPLLVTALPSPLQVLALSTLTCLPGPPTLPLHACVP